MRPKKVILLVDGDKNRLSVLTFSLVTNGYNVLRANSFDEGLSLFEKSIVDLAVVDLALPGEKNGDDLIVEMKKLRQVIPMMLGSDPEKFISCHADRTVFLKKLPMSLVLDHFKIMTTRKRGPHKGTVKTVQPVDISELAVVGAA